MEGPFPLRTHSAFFASVQWELDSGLVCRKRHRIIKPFMDADGDAHPAGEEWIFVTSMFSAYDDEYSLVVRILDAEWRIALGSRGQNEIIDNLRQYVAVVS